jgi:hypothetical protein
MGMTKLQASAAAIVAAWVAGSALVGPGRAGRPLAADQAPAKAPAKAAQTSKLDLTPGSLPKLHALIRPHDHEWRHLRVRWLTDPAAALKKAAAEDKPIVLLYLGGAGYNSALGTC